MQSASETLVGLETRFWQSMVDEDSDTAVQMLTEPALMVSPHGTIKFDHAGYRRMAEQGPTVLKSFELGDMEVVFPNDTTAILTYRVKQRVATRGGQKSKVQEMNDTSTWIQKGKHWQCAMHTESPVSARDASS